jgi:hypothetical protein
MRTAELHQLLDVALEQDGHTAVSGVRRLREHLVWIERRAVQRARADGLNWAEIGRLLGISRQAASERFNALLGTPPTVPATEPDRTFRTRPKEEPEPVAW